MDNSIIQELEILEKESMKLSFNQDERTEIFDSYQHLASDFLTTLSSKKAFEKGKSDRDLYTINGWPEDHSKIQATIKNDLFKYGINAASGGHLGYIPGGGIYTAAIGDYLAAISNAYSGVYYASPGAVEMEMSCINWLKTVFDFPDNAVGNLTSGGSIANIIALTAARDHKKLLDGEISSSVVYLTEQTHHSFEKALRLIGLEKITRRFILSDENSRMKLDELENQIKLDQKNGLCPQLVVGSAGTTDTGAVDPLLGIANLAEKYAMWFHVDAAYGGFFKMVDEAKDKFKGIEKADSLIVDPHKGLFLPYGSGAVLVKNKEAVLHSNRLMASYMQDTLDEETPINPADVSPELTKHFRAFRMWLPLKIHGVAPFKAALKEKLLLTRYFQEKIKELGFKTGPKPDLSVTYFWFPFGENHEDKKNKKLLDLCHNDGRVFLSSTSINGRFVIRMAILSFRTHQREIEKALEMLSDNLKKISI